MPVTRSRSKDTDIATDKPRANFYLEPEVYEALEILADTEDRSISKMGAILVQEALIARGLLSPQKKVQARKSRNSA